MMANTENIKNKGFDMNPENINKKGAPKGKRTSTILKELLNMDMSKYDKTKKGMTINEAIAIELMTMVFRKDVSNRDKLRAIKEILDRVEGKPVQTKIIEPIREIKGITFN